MSRRYHVMYQHHISSNEKHPPDVLWRVLVDMKMPSYQYFNHYQERKPGSSSVFVMAKNSAVSLHSEAWYLFLRESLFCSAALATMECKASFLHRVLRYQCFALHGIRLSTEQLIWDLADSPITQCSWAVKRITSLTIGYGLFRHKTTW